MYTIIIEKSLEQEDEKYPKTETVYKQVFKDLDIHGFVASLNETKELGTVYAKRIN
jgi:hypothetical protein|tara:strand:- start:88 stop:255 length:168 start_codon:yes stop_codon:yes gene_type:complete